LSNDYSVAQAAIDSINRIDDVCYESGINITNALMDNYEKEIEMKIYGEQFFGEGWLDKTDDESIIKTIFLAIPRFIMHLINLIKKRWENIKMAKINEEQIAKYEEALLENEKAKAENEAAKEEQRKLDSALNDIPNVIINKSTGNFEYLSDIKDYKDLIDAYKLIGGFFKSYEEAARDYTGKLDAFTNLHYDIKTYIDRNIFSDRNDVHYVLIPEFRKLMDKVIDTQEETSKSIRKSMQTVNKWYNDKMSQKSKTSSGQIEMVNRIFNDIRVLRDDFSQFDARVFKSISAAKLSFIKLDQKADEYNKMNETKTKKSLFSDLDNDDDEE
jgi:hypothetical protein